MPQPLVTISVLLSYLNQQQMYRTTLQKTTITRGTIKNGSIVLTYGHADTSKHPENYCSEIQNTCMLISLKMVNF